MKWVGPINNNPLKNQCGYLPNPEKLPTDCADEPFFFIESANATEPCFGVAMFSVDLDVGFFDHFVPARKISLDLLGKLLGLVAHRLEAALEIALANFRERQHGSHFPLKAIDDRLGGLGRRQQSVP